MNQQFAGDFSLKSVKLYPILQGNKVSQNSVIDIKQLVMLKDVKLTSTRELWSTFHPKQITVFPKVIHMLKRRFLSNHDLSVF
jgi:hypothetical protein